MAKKQQKLPRHEELLLDYAERLKNHRRGRSALHVRISLLASYNRRIGHLRIAENAFEKLIKTYEGRIFCLANGDLMFIARDIPDSAIDDIVLKLRMMFREDPFIELAENETNENAFCVSYDIDKNYAAFLGKARELFYECEQLLSPMGAQGPASSTSEPGRPALPLKPLTPVILGRLEDAIEGADLSNLIRKQAICAITPGMPPSPIFYERFISIDGLRKSYLPDIDFQSNRWLFHHLVERLDGRMLAALPEYLANLPVPTSINSTISTILSEKFLLFDSEYKQIKKRKTLVFEFQAVDILADINAYMFARDFLRSNGYKICIDGLDPLTFSMIFRDQMQADLEKVVWSQDLVNKLKGGWREHFAAAVERAGSTRVVLCRCDDAAAIEFGYSMGIHLFQGYYIDEMLNSRRAPDIAVNY